MQPLKKVGAGLSPISELVSSRLLEDKAGQSAVIDSYALKWTFDNELALVVVIVYQKMLKILWTGSWVCIHMLTLTKYRWL